MQAQATDQNFRSQSSPASSAYPPRQGNMALRVEEQIRSYANLAGNACVSEMEAPVSDEDIPPLGYAVAQIHGEIGRAHV